MKGEFSIYGIYIPWLLLLALLALLLARVCSYLLARTGFYRWVWHPPLFDLALLITLLGVLTFFLSNGLN
ncbi:DUF1656 domain-containing protein [Undibacterium sp. SXout7W]|uniref:DUF1656 domain-containing protein n=1 Tax=Undibacterium sp. SXout7W TaxID=3413049 RepID=UPI003BEFA036